MRLDKIPPDMGEQERAALIFELVFSLMQKNQYDEIPSFCDLVLQTNPNEAVAHQIKSTYFRGQERYDEAINCADKAIKYAGPYFKPVYIAMKAAIMYDIGRYDESETLVDTSMRYGENAFLLDLKGLLLHQKYNKTRDKYTAKEILRCYDKALNYNDVVSGGNGIDFTNIFSSNTESSYNDQVVHSKGLLLLDLGKYNTAIQSFDKELSTCPNDQETLANKALALYHIGKKDESIKCCRQLAELPAIDSDTLFSLCARFYDLELFDEALHTINKVLKLNPSNPRAIKYKRVIELKLRSNNDESNI